MSEHEMSSADDDTPAMWCDGTPHSPNAIPPLPFHDWRCDLDNPWLICARCGQRNSGPGPLAEQGRRLASQRDDLIAAGVDPSALAVPIYPESEGEGL